MNEALLDTDILSYFLRNVPAVRSNAASYLAGHAGFTFSVITKYEILSGLKVKDATRQLAKFDFICSKSKVIDVTDGVSFRAADIFAALHKSGQIVGDADILIAATALEYSLPIVTNNVAHFSRISGLKVINWNE